jgi:hypothetical protein
VHLGLLVHSDRVVGPVREGTQSCGRSGSGHLRSGSGQLENDAQDDHGDDGEHDDQGLAPLGPLIRSRFHDQQLCQASLMIWIRLMGYTALVRNAY